MFTFAHQHAVRNYLVQHELHAHRSILVCAVLDLHHPTPKALVSLASQKTTLKKTPCQTVVTNLEFPRICGHASGTIRDAPLIKMSSLSPHFPCTLASLPMVVIM